MEIITPQEKRTQDAMLDGSMPEKLRRGRQYQTTEEESLSASPETIEELREIKSGVFCDLRREYLYDRVVIEKEDGKKEVTYRKRRLQFSGMPRLLSVYTVEKRGHKSRDEETFYKVEFSLRPDIAPETFTEREINAGEWLAHWPGLAITARKDRDFYGDILKAQVMPFRLPVGRAKSETGWHQDAVSKLWTYAFRDGRLLTSEPELSNPNIPIAGYNFVGSTHARAWQEGMSQAPSRASAEEAIELLAWWEEIDIHGRPALLAFGAYRSLLDSIERVGMAVIVAAGDELEARDGSSGAGKTTSIDFARGVDGPCPYRSSPECSFRGTLAGIETRIAHTHDLPISVADFHLPETPTESEFSKWAATVDALVSSAADNAEIKERSTKTLDARRGATIGGLLIMDGEKLHPLLLSRLRRVAILFFRRGEIDAGAMHAGWDEYQAIHTRIGHTILRRALAALNKDEQAFIRKLRTVEAGYEQELITKFSQEHAAFDQQIARSLAHNFARFITGAWLAETATGADSILVETAKDLAYEHMEAQAKLLDGGGPSTVTGEWILRTTRLLLDESRAHALAMNNDELDHKLHGFLQVWGYRRSGLTDKPWAVSGPHLLNLADDGSTCYLKSTLWQELLKTQAQRERIKWTHTERTFAEALVKLNIVTPEYTKNGLQKQSAQRVYIDGKRERRLAVATVLLDIDNQEYPESPETPGPGGPGYQSQEHHQAASTEPGPDRHPESTEPGQAAARVLLAELAARGGSLRPEPASRWAICLPDEWTEEEYQELVPRVFALDSELRQLLQGQAASTEPGQSEEDQAFFEALDRQAEQLGLDLSGGAADRQPESTESGQAGAGQERAARKTERKPFGVLFADIRAGQAITESGARFTFPANCSLSEFINLAVEIGPVNRVYICGPRPGQGESAQDYISWLMDPDMLREYTTSKIGHYFDVLKPDMSVARYQGRQQGRADLDIRRIHAWLGDDRDSQENTIYSIEDARAALLLVTKSLRKHFPLFHNLSGTPSTTFKYLWQQGNHIAKKHFPPLSEEIRALIHQNSGQGRIEYFPENCKGKIPGLYYYDGIFMYAALDWGLPTEVESHDTEPVYAGKQSARYRIGYTIPGDWNRAGVFMTKRDGADWRDKDGWWYPGRGQAGQTFETWVDGSELDVLIQHYSDMPAALPEDATREQKEAYRAAKGQAEQAGQEQAFSAWQIEIRERIVFKPEKESTTSKPMETITKKMVEIRDAFEADKRQDIKHAHIYDMARGAARNILLHGIGSFNRGQRTKTFLLMPGETPPAMSRQAEYTTLADGRQLVIIPEESEADDMMHPEYSAAIWARCRARVTREILLIDYEDLVTVRTDAVATKRRQERLAGGKKPGQFRLKWEQDKPLTGPTSHEKFDAIQHKIQGK